MNKKDSAPAPVPLANFGVEIWIPYRQFVSLPLGNDASLFQAYDGRNFSEKGVLKFCVGFFGEQSLPSSRGEQIYEAKNTYERS